MRASLQSRPARAVGRQLIRRSPTPDRGGVIWFCSGVILLRLTGRWRSGADSPRQGRDDEIYRQRSRLLSEPARRPARVRTPRRRNLASMGPPGSNIADTPTEIDEMDALTDEWGGLRLSIETRERLGDWLAWVNGMAEALDAPSFAAGAVAFTSGIVNFTPKAAHVGGNAGAAGDFDGLNEAVATKNRPVAKLRPKAPGRHITVVQAPMSVRGFAAIFIQPIYGSPRCLQEARRPSFRTGRQCRPAGGTRRGDRTASAPPGAVRPTPDRCPDSRLTPPAARRLQALLQLNRSIVAGLDGGEKSMSRAIRSLDDRMCLSTAWRAAAGSRRSSAATSARCSSCDERIWSPDRRCEKARM